MDYRPGMTVPGRKRRAGGVNTFLGLDYISAAKELNHAKRMPDAGACLPPRRDMPYAPSVRICARMNRATLSRDQYVHAFDQARALSLKIDYVDYDPTHLMHTYNAHVAVLKAGPQRHFYHKLIELEAARGVTRAVRS